MTADPNILPMTDEAKELLVSAFQCDGAEVPRDLWRGGEELMAAGLAQLGRARGPDGDWRRLALTERGHALAAAQRVPD